MYLEHAGTVERALAILAMICRNGEARLVDIHNETALHKTTLLRLLDGLLRSGYIRKDPKTLVYSVTARIAEFSHMGNLFARPAELAGPMIRQFRLETKCPCNFALMERTSLEIVEIQGDAGISVSQHTLDFSRNLMLTSKGIVILAFSSEEDRKRLLKGIESHDEITELLSRPETFYTRLSLIRKQGYAFSDSAFPNRARDSSILGLAVPITNEERVYGAVRVVYTPTSISETEALEQFLQPLKNLAAQIIDVLDNEKHSLGSTARYIDA